MSDTVTIALERYNRLRDVSITASSRGENIVELKRINAALEGESMRNKYIIECLRKDIIELTLENKNKGWLRRFLNI